MLFNTLDELAEATAHWPDLRLESPWQWGSYDNGVRFAFFRLYETLSTLAGRLRTARIDEGLPLTEVQQLLGHYHAAFRDLQGACRGLDNIVAAITPAADDWSVTQTYAHILGGDIGFRVLVRHAWRRFPEPGDRPEAIPEAAWDEMMSESTYTALMAEPLSELQHFHADFHADLLDELVGLPDAALGWPARYWEEELYPLRFRLQRFDAHVRQHVIQIEKVRQALGRPLSETLHLLRLIDRARAELENALLGAPSGWHETLLQAADGELRHYVAAITGAAA